MDSKQFNQIEMKKIIGISFLIILLFSLSFILFTGTKINAQEKQGSWQSQDDRVRCINQKAKVLDRDGYKQVITGIYDTFETPDFILASGSRGQSPLYKIPKKDVLVMELDGFYTNMSGWDYAGCELTLTGNRKKKGYLKVFHMGLHGYRAFKGHSNVGEFMISFKRLKKVEFIGDWEVIPLPKRGETNPKAIDTDNGNKDNKQDKGDEQEKHEKKTKK